MLALFAGLILACSPSFAQLNGTYTIGGASPSYASIDAALTALNAGVSGPVTFLIRSGTYTPPTNGWRLWGVTGLSATNTVTFKPDAGATVALTGNTGSFTQSGVFTLDGARYYIIDGSNTNGGTSRDMTITSLEVNYNPAIFLKNNSDFNVIKNCNLRGSATSGNTTYGYGVVYFGMGTPNDENRVQNCQIGDPAGVYRCYAGVGMYGPGVTTRNTNNAVVGCDIINFNTYGIYIDANNTTPLIQGNQIHMTVASPNSFVGGIYINENTYAISSTIDKNRIYKLLPTITSSGTIYGIQLSINNVPTGTTTITNNMISMAENGYINFYAIYLYNFFSIASATYTENVYNNSVYIGGTASSFSQVFAIYRYNQGSATANSIVNHRNNAYYSVRSGGSTTSYGMYVYSTPVVTGWNSNNNLININSETNYYTAYYNFSLYQTLASYRTSGQDAASVGSNPQFVDPVNGDLHIVSSNRTAVEGRGAVVAGITTDIDGDTRNATTPDIGADEGNFLAPLTIDAAADRFTLPKSGATVRSNTIFSPVAFVENAGTTAQVIPTRLRILNSSNTVVYNDLLNYSVQPLTPQRAGFNAFGNNGGSTSLPAGDYTMELSTALLGDGQASNNIITGPLYVRDQLNGVYTINPNGSGPRNFKSFTAALGEMNLVGISGPVSFKVATAVYDASIETLPIRFGLIPGASAVNTVTVKPDENAYPIITGSVTGRGILDFDDADYCTFDGSNKVGGTTRDFTIVNNGNSPAVRFFNAAQNNTVKNMYLVAANTQSTGVVHIAGYGGTASGNSRNTIQSNTIGDSTGAIRSMVGIYLTGDFSYRSQFNRVEDNDIINWGTSTNNGGYGIYFYYYNDNVKILNNRIRHTMMPVGTLNASYGIYVSNFYNTNDTIAGNKIWDLQSSPTATTIGIYGQTLGQASPLAIRNNMIMLTANSGSPMGIYLASSSPSTYTIANNSILIRGTSSGSNYLSAGIRTAGTPNVTMRNNIIINERTYPSGTNNYAIYRGTSTGTFTSDYNILYSAGSATAVGYNIGPVYATLTNWQALGFDANSKTGRPRFVNEATGNLHVDTVRVFAGEGMGIPFGVLNDVDNQVRDALTPDIGADEGDFNGGGLTLTYPNTEEVYMPLETFNVLYTTNRVMSTRVDLSYDAGATWTQLAAVNPTVKGANSTPVTLPDQPSNQAMVRVISQRNQYEADTSNTTFRIVRKLKLTAPNGTETLYVGDKTHIRWGRLPGEMLAENVNFEYSYNSGITWHPIVTQVPGYLDSLEWTVPNTPSTDVKVRITNSQQEKFWDTSDVSFAIVEPTLQVTAPNGGERYDLEQPVTVSWMSQNVARLRLDYSADGGVSWQMINGNIDASLGSYTFTPNAIPTRLALVRLTDVDRTRIKDESNAQFEIMAAQTISVLSPVTGDVYVRNSTALITWSAPRMERVHILYSPNNGTGWVPVVNDVQASLGSYVWTVPNQTTTQGRIRVQDAGGQGTGESGVFSIVDPSTPAISLIAPAGGEKYTSGDTITLSWTANDVANFDIHYKSDGVNWIPIRMAVPGFARQMKWVAPDIPGTNYRVRVKSSEPGPSSESEAFEIMRRAQPKIAVIYPNGGENLTADSTVEIRWTVQDVDGMVDVEFFNGKVWSTVGPPVDAKVGKLQWKVPNDTTKQGRIRVTQQGTSVSATSNGPFEISRRVMLPIVVTAPDGGEEWRMKSNQAIKWISPVGVDKVDIHYATNGVDWQQIRAGFPSTPGNNEYVWTLPESSSEYANTVLVRVRNSMDSSQLDISNAAFSILFAIAGVEHGVAGMGSLRILGNYPNPFAGRTEIRWMQGKRGAVEIRVYQQNGALVASHEVGDREAGEQRYGLRVDGLATGAYIYEVRAGGEAERSVMMVVR